MSYFHGYGNDRKDGDSVLWWIVTKLYHVSKIELILRSTGIQNIVWKMSLPARNCRKPLTKLSSTNTVYKCYKFCGNCVSEDFSLHRCTYNLISCSYLQFKLLGYKFLYTHLRLNVWNMYKIWVMDSISLLEMHNLIFSFVSKGW